MALRDLRIALTGRPARGIAGTAAKVSRDSAGNVLPLAAVGMIVLTAMVGGGIDLSRAYKTESRLQSACDAAVLAGRRAITTNGFDTAARTKAEAFFSTNFGEGDRGTHDTAFEPTSTDNGNTVNGTASTSVSTVVMRLFGYDEVAIDVACSASMGVGNSDVTMVLDTTGSMNSTLAGTTQTRIQALRAAMKNFYATVAASTSGTNARIRYGFVPYSSSVNVGQLLIDRDPDFLVNSYNIQSRAPVLRTVTNEVFDHFADPVYTYNSGTSAVTTGSLSLYSSTSYKKSKDCTDAVPANTAWSNDGSSTTGDPVTTTGSNGQKIVTTTVSQPQKATYYTCASSSGKYYVYKYPATRTTYSYTYATSSPVYKTVTSQVFDHFEYRQVAYDTSRFKLFNSASVPNGTNGASVSYLWKGCIEERKTVANSTFSFSLANGITPSGARDLDIDSEPDPSNPQTQWAPMWPDVAYIRTTSRGSISNVATSLYGSKAGSYCPKPARLLGEITSEEFGAYADALAAEGSTYHDLGMIWGARLSSPEGIFSDNVTEEPRNGGEVSRHILFMTDGIMEPNYTIQTTYGIEFHDRRVTSDGYSNDDDRHNSRFLAVCEAAKAKGIRVWVIAFSSELTTPLETCASDNSSFTASSATELNEAFQEIAKQVGELRIIQ